MSRRRRQYRTIHPSMALTDLPYVPSSERKDTQRNAFRKGKQGCDGKASAFQKSPCKRATWTGHLKEVSCDECIKHPSSVSNIRSLFCLQCRGKMCSRTLIFAQSHRQPPQYHANYRYVDACVRGVSGVVCDVSLGRVRAVCVCSGRGLVCVEVRVCACSGCVVWWCVVCTFRMNKAFGMRWILEPLILKQLCDYFRKQFDTCVTRRLLSK